MLASLKQQEQDHTFKEGGCNLRLLFQTGQKLE